MVTTHRQAQQALRGVSSPFDTHILNEAHLRWVAGEYVRYYNERRPHQSLGHLPPEAMPEYPRHGEIVSRPVLGGLINDYCRLAA